MKPFRFSLTFTILSALVCLLVLTWLLLSLISFKTAENDLLTQKNEQGRLLLSSFIAVLSSPSASSDNEISARRLADRFAQEPDFAGLVLIDAGGKKQFAVPDAASIDSRLFDVLKNGRESHFFSADSRFVHRYAPVFSKGRLSGAARLTLSLAGEQARLNRSRHIFLAYFLLDSLMLLGLGYLILTRVVVAPFRRLLSATEKISAGDYGHSVHVPGCAEVAELAESFNAMVARLREKRLEVESHVQSLERANRDLEAAREETIRSEKMASVGLLAAGMAHEVGTPLSSIIGFAGILRDELQDDPEKADYLRRIENEACRIDRIVRGLLDYARPSRVELEPVRLSDVIGATVDLLAAQGALKGINVELALAEGLPQVSADRHELQQVVINLLLNARDAMPGGGKISIETFLDGAEFSGEKAPSHPHPVMGRRREDFHGAFLAQYPEDSDLRKWIAIAVKDTGCGIAPEHLGKVFDPFFTTKEPGQGTGLGLAISARIIDSFGGRIVAESEPGRGTIFSILLPAVEPIDAERKT